MGFTDQEPLPFTPEEADINEKEWYTFTLQMDKSDWTALQEFFEERHIDYRNF